MIVVGFDHQTGRFVAHTHRLLQRIHTSAATSQVPVRSSCLLGFWWHLCGFDSLGHSPQNRLVFLLHFPADFHLPVVAKKYLYTTKHTGER